MQKINKKINEVYISKKVILLIPYRNKTRRIVYIITDISGTDFQMTATLRAVKYPCEIPNLGRIEMQLNNEFPTKQMCDKL